MLSKKIKIILFFLRIIQLLKKKELFHVYELTKIIKKKYYRNILETKYHLSFPFIFKYKSCFYLIPETSEINSINIYKCVKFPNKWKFYKKLFKSKSVDHIIFKHKNNWFLLNNESDIKQIYSKLVGYVSNNPLSNKWKKIKILKNSFLLGRNAGYIETNKRKYRVSQSYLPGRYGAGIFINQIKNISGKNYNESVEKKYFPKIFSEIKGIHTLNSVKNFTVFDFSRWQN